MNRPVQPLRILTVPILLWRKLFGHPGAKPLSDAELRELADFLERDHGQPGLGTLANIHALDGYLTSLAVGPQPIHPGDWLELVFGHAGAPPLRIGRLMQRRMEAVARQCAQQPPEYQPLLETHPKLGEASLDAWCRGFTLGTILRDREWRRLLRKKDSNAWLRPIWSRADAQIPANHQGKPTGSLEEAAALDLAGIKSAVVKLPSCWPRS